jgi:hypothetical protein
MNKLIKQPTFSFEEYREIIRTYKPIIKDFKDIDENSINYCLIRHDVEFLLERALVIAEIDHDEGIKSSFFIQVMNSAYNPLSTRNKSILSQIDRLGHNIGLHLYSSHIEENDTSQMIAELESQVQILQLCIEKKVDRFSFHRPPSWALGIDFSKHTNLINAYGPLYFELIKNNEMPKKIKYFADSNHKWNYGHPLETNNYNAFQLCLHPDEWLEEGGDETENFTKILKESRINFLDIIDSEYKTFAKIRNCF